MLTQADINNLPDLDDSMVGSFDSPLKGNLVNFHQDKTMSNEDYHNRENTFYGIPAMRYLSGSLLKNCLTPTHIKQYLTENREPSKAMKNGTAMHSLFLEPEKFEYYLFDDSEKVKQIGGDKPRGTKEYREWKANEEKKNAGKLALLKEDFQSIWQASKRLDKYKLIKDLMKDSIRESSFFCLFQVEDQELYAKIRPDAYTIANDEFEHLGIDNGDLIIISVKTTKDASPGGFWHEFNKNKYHITEAFYYDVMSEIFPEIKIHTIVIATEPETGLFMCYKLREETIEGGRLAYMPLLENWTNTDVNKLLATETPSGYEVMTGGKIVIEL